MYVSNVRTGLPTNGWDNFTEFYSLFPYIYVLHFTVYGILLSCFLTFMILCNYKLVSKFAKSLKRPYKDYLQSRKLNLTLESS